MAATHHCRVCRWAAVRCLILTVHIATLIHLVNSKDTTTFRDLFSRHSNQRLSAITAKFINNSTVDACADLCVKETEFQCKSFDLDNNLKSCLLFKVDLDDRDVHLIESSGKDHYETAYTTLFNRLPSHRLPVMTNRAVDGISREGCARRCILESYFKCRGFNYRDTDERCMLVENTPATSTGALFTADMDYYEKKPEGSLSEFINFGMGRMRPLEAGLVHQRGARGLTLKECAATCLEEDTFECLSFDYVFEGVDSDCHLSKYIAANVGGLVIDNTNVHNNVQHNHYEKKGEWVNYFYPTPYAAIPGNNLKTYERVTPDRCARFCITEDSFICRSFDYRIYDATCMLSGITGSDVGGLTTEGGYEGDVHHFEMKPILDCGGNLTDPEGDVASPNWPRDYTHHEQCVWHISTSKNKILHLIFTHFDLGLDSSDPCGDQADRLVVTEKGQEEYCVLPNTKIIDTKSNEITVAFHSNSQVDAQGFRMFYSAEWTCNEHLTEPGEIASPKWPSSYPSNTRCSWRITAPHGHRIQLTFTAFDLEQHTLGHCNEKLDHVKIQDGGTVSSPLVGLYCGSRESLTVKSTSEDMFVQFVSDHDPDNVRQGFHAQFIFENKNGTLFDGGVLAGPGYKRIGEDDGLTALDNEAEQGKSEAQGATGEKEGYITLAEHHKYKSTMWAVVTVLLLLLVVAAIGMFLLYRHFRGRLYGEVEVIHQDGMTIPLQDVPPANLRSPKPNNDYDRVALTISDPIPMSCGEPSTSGGAAAPLMDAKPNNLDIYPGKYAKENIKNINIDTKYYDEDDTCT